LEELSSGTKNEEPQIRDNGTILEIAALGTLGMIL
jgi:hypothetical protein